MRMPWQLINPAKSLRIPEPDPEPSFKDQLRQGFRAALTYAGSDGSGRLWQLSRGEGRLLIAGAPTITYSGRPNLVLFEDWVRNCIVATRHSSATKNIPVFCSDETFIETAKCMRLQAHDIRTDIGFKAGFINVYGGYRVYILGCGFEVPFGDYVAVSGEFISRYVNLEDEPDNA